MKRPDQGLREAQPSRVDLRSPCEACPVRPLSICSALTIEELSHLERSVTKITVNSGAPIFDESLTVSVVLNPSRIRETTIDGLKVREAAQVVFDRERAATVTALDAFLAQPPASAEIQLERN